MANNSRNAYGFGKTGPLPRLTPTPVIAQRSPVVGDTGYELGTIWINSNSASSDFNDVWMLTSVAAGVANWEPVSNDAGGGAPITKYVVDADGTGDYTTIQAAINAANAAGGNATVYVRPGTYTENLTLYTTVDVVGAVAEGVTITGVHTPPAAGRFKFQDVYLTSATHIFSSAVAGTAKLLVNDCVIGVTNGYLFNLANWTGILSVNSTTSLGSTNDGFINNASTATVYVTNSDVGTGVGNPSVMTGTTVQIISSSLNCPATIGGAGSILFTEGAEMFATLTTAGTATAVIELSSFKTGATAAISHGSAGVMSLSQVTIDSSNATPIGGAGAGVITFGDVSYLQNSAIAGTLTIAYSRVTDRTTPFVVGASGTYATIQAAITAANAIGSDASIYIQPGTYTEDLTLYDGISLWGADALFTTIIGTHTPPAAGTVICNYLTLQSATDVFNSAAAGTTEVQVNDCIINVTNGYLFNLVNWTGTLTLFNSTSVGGTNDGFVNNTGGATVYVANSDAGVGIGNSAVLTGSTLQLISSSLGCPATLGGAGSVLMTEGAEVFHTFTTAGTSTGIIEQTSFKTGATAAISHGSAGTLTISSTSITSSNNPAIDGAGAGLLLLSGVEFTDGSNLAATLALSSAAETRSTKLLCGDATYPVTALTNEYNVVQAFGSTVETIADQINAIEGNMVVDVAASILQPTGLYGYCEQVDGSTITSTAAGVEGHLNLLETDNADLPAVYAFAVKAYLDSSDAAGIPAGIVAGVGSIVEYNTPFDAKAYGVAVSRLDAGGGAGTAGQAAFGIVQGSVAAADWLYGLDLYNGASGVAYTTADIRMQNESTIAVDTTGVTFSGDVATRAVTQTNTKITAFNADPIGQLNGGAGALCTGATGTVNNLHLQDGIMMQSFMIGAGQTLIVPTLAADGLLIGLDVANSEGVEYNFGTQTTSKHAYLIGTDADFFFECKFKIGTSAGADPMVIGFRSVEANNATFTAYTDYAAIGVITTQNANVITLATEVGGGGTTYTNTTDAWTDGQEHTLRVNVTTAGVVTYLIDGVAPGVTAAYTFTDALRVMPFISFVQPGGATTTLHLQSMECGFQAWN